MPTFRIMNGGDVRRGWERKEEIFGLGSVSIGGKWDEKKENVWSENENPQQHQA